MTTFADLGGTTRTIQIGFRLLTHLRIDNGVRGEDLIGTDGAGLREIVLDPVRFAGVLFTLAGRPGESAEAFYSVLGLETLEAAAPAFVAAVLAYWLGPRAAEVLDDAKFGVGYPGPGDLFPRALSQGASHGDAGEVQPTGG